MTAHAYAPSVQITKEDDRPWVEKWRTIQHHVGVLREIYSGTAQVGNIEAESRATATAPATKL